MMKSAPMIKTIVYEKNADLVIANDMFLVGEAEYIKWKDIEKKYGCQTKLGNLNGLLYTWKAIDSEFICVNWGEVLPAIDQDQLQKLYNGEIKMILPRVYCSNHLQETYREQYYGFDLRVLASLLKERYKSVYDCACENVLNKNQLFLCGGAFDKKEFDEICRWMFEVLFQCEQLLPKRVSSYQNMALEHLAPYLFTIYIQYKYSEEKYILDIPTKLVSRESKGRENKKEQDSLLSKREDIENCIDSCMKQHKVEEAIGFIQGLSDNNPGVAEIKKIFYEYNRQRRYYALTDLDREKNWKNLYYRYDKVSSIGLMTQKPKMLIFQWASVGHKVNVRALESFGFECHTIQIPHNMHVFDEGCLEQINCHMDRNKFDVVFSLNCSGMVAEACHIHNIPYIAWCYDAPSCPGRQWYLLYPTTHVFLFDSDDANHYCEAGIIQSHYLPLAVNLEYFDKITCTEEDRKKYGTEVSFVGSLYESTLPKAMGFLTDYQKGYLNALIDTQMDIYGHSFFPEIISQELVEWLSQPEFNQLINSEWEKNKAKDTTVNPGRLQLLLNKQTTNKERILLLNLLAKYYNVDLYSYKNNAALKNLTFRGTADYYTEMPKIFRNSKINLNATLRSIQTGIPLRCLDIMGCHGLLLTNYQKDFDDHFQDGKNVLFYTDAEEALDKAGYYLSHEEERVKIAEEGYRTIKEFYDYPVKLQELFSYDGLDYLIPKERGNR